MHSLLSKSYKIICYVVTAIVALYGVFIAYNYFTSGIDWDMPIDWNPLHWPNLIISLFIYGYVAEISIGIWITYEEGSIIDGVFESDGDILSVLFGQIVFPLVFFFFLGPAIIAVISFYVIIGALALFGTLIPYVILVLFLLLAIPFYLGARYLLPRRWRAILLTIWTILFVAFQSLALIPIWGDFDFSASNLNIQEQLSGTPKHIKEVKVSVETANLRTGPGKNYPYAFKKNKNGVEEKWQLHRNDRLLVVEIIGDWYKAIPLGDDENSEIYISTKLCRD